jgi:hypothetical protein
MELIVSEVPAPPSPVKIPAAMPSQEATVDAKTARPDSSPRRKVLVRRAGYARGVRERGSRPRTAHSRAAHPWERIVAERLEDEITGMEGTVLTGYKIPSREGEIDIDNILVCEVGIYTIECKRATGIIRGRRNDEWTFERDSKRGVIHAQRGNPADQANSQMYALKNFLAKELPDENVFVTGLVLFPDDADLQIENVAINKFSRNAPSAFTLSAFCAAIANKHRGREIERLARERVRTIANCIRKI